MECYICRKIIERRSNCQKYCIECKKEIFKKQNKIACKKYRNKPKNKLKMGVYWNNYSKKNKEKINLKRKERYKKQKEKVLDWHKKWLINHKHENNMQTYADKCFRNELIKRSKCICEICKDNKGKDIYHIKYTKNISDCLWVCRSCHRKEHIKRIKRGG